MRTTTSTSSRSTVSRAWASTAPIWSVPDHVGLDFTKFINRLVEVASARYFGTPHPPSVSAAKPEPREHVFAHITARRDRMERRLREWVNLQSRTGDPLGLQQAMQRASELFHELGMKEVPALSNSDVVTTWETARGLDGGILLVGNLDVPVGHEFPTQSFRRDPEWLYGEGVGTSRGPLVMLEYALRALRSLRRLRHLPLAVLYYTDEGQDARRSADQIRAAAARAKDVLILRPGIEPDKIVVQRRGQRVFQLRVESESLRLGRSFKKPDALRWATGKLDEISQLTSQNQRIAVSTLDVRAERLPMHLPHRVVATIAESYPTTKTGESIANEMRAALGKGGPRWELVTASDRPPFVERPAGRQLADELTGVAESWDMTLKRESSGWPSVAGLVPDTTACVCGIGPVAHHLQTPQEAVRRMSLVQRTLLLAEFLVGRLGAKTK